MQRAMSRIGLTLGFYGGIAVVGWVNPPYPLLTPRPPPTNPSPTDLPTPLHARNEKQDARGNRPHLQPANIRAGAPEPRERQGDHQGPVRAALGQGFQAESGEQAAGGGAGAAAEFFDWGGGGGGEGEGIEGERGEVGTRGFWEGRVVGLLAVGE